jgi:hypothetical protein
VAGPDIGLGVRIAQMACQCDGADKSELLPVPDAFRPDASREGLAEARLELPRAETRAQRMRPTPPMAGSPGRVVTSALVRGWRPGEGFADICHGRRRARPTVCAIVIPASPY